MVLLVTKFILVIVHIITSHTVLVTSICTDKRHDCKMLSRFGWCNERPSTMRKVCSVTCKFCSSKQDYLQKTPLTTTTTTTATTKATDCTDKRGDCKSFRNFGWCHLDSRKETMKVLCSNTCGFCKASTTTTTTRQPKTVSKKGKCGDLRNDCANLAARGFCKKQEATMERLCPASCNVCPMESPIPKTTPSSIVCMDRMKGCNIMLNRGFCTRNKKQMITRCRKTCHLCPTCSDQRNDCERYKRFGWCARKEKEMAVSCPVTCNLCHMVKPTPRPKAICIDQRGSVQCGKMARLGFCQARPAMKTHCSKTCGVCGGKPRGGNNIPTNPPTRPKPITVTDPRCHGAIDRYGRARCDYYSHIGWCEKHQKIKQNCVATCLCTVRPTAPPPKNGNCKSARYGCCWDKKTVKTDRYGSSCPVCKDDPRFVVLCQRFGGDCNGNAALAKSLRKHCSKTCNLC